MNNYNQQNSKTFLIPYGNNNNNNKHFRNYNYNNNNYTANPYNNIIGNSVPDPLKMSQKKGLIIHMEIIITIIILIHII